MITLMGIDKPLDCKCSSSIASSNENSSMPKVERSIRKIWPRRTVEPDNEIGGLVSDVQSGEQNPELTASGVRASIWSRARSSTFDCLSLFTDNEQKQRPEQELELELGLELGQSNSDKKTISSSRRSGNYEFRSYRKCATQIMNTIFRKIFHLNAEEVPYNNIDNERTKNDSNNQNHTSAVNEIHLQIPVKRPIKKTARLSIQNESNAETSRDTSERNATNVDIQSATTSVDINTKISADYDCNRPLPKLPHKRQTVNVPRFFFPNGKPISMLDNEVALRRVSEVFNRIGNQADMTDMSEICKAAGIPVYWKRAVFESCSGMQSRPIKLADFAGWWNKMTSVAHDEASRFVYTLAGAHRNYLTKEDFEPLLLDLIETFPGLHFLREAQEFHARYVETTIRKLQTTEDINLITDYFSYEHFYVIYCKFYELDKDHDLIINKIDMSQHANGALTPQIIDRIFSGAVTRSPSGKRVRGVIETIDYTNFVAFLLAEEDKTHPTSIEYWFRCLDLDGDGLLSMYEMEHFYNGVKRKMDQHNIDSMKFDDVLCNLLDLIQPQQPNAIALTDLRNCPMCTRFFNTFVNWVKYYEQESSEGERATVTDGEEELNDWDRYCLEEYEALMADDQDNDEPEDINLSLDDDDDIFNGSSVSTTVSLSLRDFGDSQRAILEAI